MAAIPKAAFDHRLDACSFSEPGSPLAEEQADKTFIRARRASDIPLLARRGLQLKLDCSIDRGDRSSTHGAVATSPASPLDLPHTFTADYDLGRVLGSGTVATVRKAVRRRDGRKFAVKLVRSQDEEMRQFTLDEYTLLTSLRHPSIVKMEGLHSGISCLMICMELCDLGSLDRYVSKNGIMSEASAVNFFKQLLLGVNYLHSKRIVHRDLKPANLLLQSTLGQYGSSKVLKITDFNSAKQIGAGPGASVMLSERGTQAFSAPELRFGRIWNERVDIWACGMCFYFMLHAKSPFNRGRISDLLQSGRLPGLTWGDISCHARNAIQQCLTVEMRDRPVAMELMLHPLFYGRSETICRDDQMPLEAAHKEDTLSEFVVAHHPICGLLYVLGHAEEIRATEGRRVPLLGHHISQMCSSGWKELRNHSDSLQRLAKLRYERSLIENDEDDCGSCSLSTTAPDSPIAPDEDISQVALPAPNVSQRGRAKKTKSGNNKRRYFSTHSAVNTTLVSEFDESDNAEQKLPARVFARLCDFSTTLDLEAKDDFDESLNLDQPFFRQATC